ncbi:MAG: hypothetical protein LBV23_12180, partial [Deltaproteobacteria bacterium]|nr:hypothetical protein [Deltaproteobacteria bacterium]
IVSELGVKLGKFMKKKCMSKARLITEMEKICIGVKDGHRRLLTPLTKTQRTIMGEIGLSEQDLMAYISGS